MPHKNPLPDFADPPVTEVALSVLFDDLSSLTTGHIGSLWAHFREEFPVTEDQAPLSFPIEQPTVAHGQEPKLEMAKFPRPRTWFVSASGADLIQVQHDRFAFNWRKREAPYPRYPKVRQDFDRHLSVFNQFLRDNDLGPIVPRQCEVSYVNALVEEGGINRSRTADYVSLLRGPSEGGFLQEPELVSLDTSYAIPQVDDFQGRLRISLRPATLKANGWDILLLTLTARGNPLESGGVLGFLDLGREWIVRAFAEITTPKMQETWGRVDV